MAVAAADAVGDDMDGVAGVAQVQRRLRGDVHGNGGGLGKGEELLGGGDAVGFVD